MIKDGSKSEPTSARVNCVDNGNVTCGAASLVQSVVERKSEWDWGSS